MKHYQSSDEINGKRSLSIGFSSTNNETMHKLKENHYHKLFQQKGNASLKGFDVT